MNLLAVYVDISIVPCMVNQKKECVITVGNMMILLMIKMRKNTVKQIIILLNREWTVKIIE